MPVTVTFDLEDSSCARHQEKRFVSMTHRFLDFAEQRQIKATVFVVGEIAREHSNLVRRVAEAGHEIALHGMRHQPLAEVGPTRLQRQIREGVTLLEDAAQVPVRGFRAPIFSLTPDTEWAVEQIANAGLTYSSSVLPAANPLYGWSNAPRVPCLWQNGLIELPCPVGGLWRWSIPFLGGIYLRYVPHILTLHLVANLDHQTVPWSYCHPYDIDPDEPFFVMPHANWLTSRILHTRRGATLKRLDNLLVATGGAACPLGEIAADLKPSDLPRIGAWSSTQQASAEWADL